MQNIVPKFEYVYTNLVLFFINAFRECPRTIIIVSNFQHSNFNFNSLCPTLLYELEKYENISKTDWFKNFNLDYYLLVDITNFNNPCTFLNNFFKQEIKNNVYDPLIKIWIIWRKDENVEERDLKQIFQICWNYHYANVVVSIWSTSGFRSYNFDPFINALYNLSSSRINLDEFYPKHKLRNFQKQTIRIEALLSVPFYTYAIINDQKIATGVNKKFADLIIEYFNATEASNVYAGIKYYYMIRENLYNNKSDISMNSRLTFRFHNTSFMYPIFRNDLCIIVPISEPKSPLNKMKTMISAKTWLLSVLCVLISFIFRKLQYSCGHNVMSFQRQLLTMISLLTNVSISIQRKPLKLSDAIFLASWMFFALLISFIFNAVFFKFVVFPDKYKNLDTLEDIVKSGLY